MMKVTDLIALFQQMYREHWSYIWGHAEKGCVDCSGAFVYAYKVLDHMSIAHGSNAIARKWVVCDMLPLSEARPGMAAFKFKRPGEDGYDLPERYRQGGASYDGDLSDYYHIGLVDADVHYVLNAKGTISGFCRDKLAAASGWDCVAYLKDVEYGGKDDVVMQAKVVLPSGAKGDTVNMRSGPGKNYEVIGKVPVGTTVDLLVDQGTWCKIDWDGQTGWMMSNYLEYEGQDGESNTLTDEEVRQIDDALRQITAACETIGTIVGRG